MNKTQCEEVLLSTMFRGSGDIQAPHAQNGLLPMWMWNLYTLDGVTTAIHPAVAQEKTATGWRETSGLAWRRHEDGEWIKGEQQMRASFDLFIEHHMLPALAAGATLCKPAPEAQEVMHRPILSAMPPQRPGKAQDAVRIVEDLRAAWILRDLTQEDFDRAADAARRLAALDAPEAQYEGSESRYEDSSL